MPDLVRYRPEAVPPIHPVPEYLADVGLKQRYEAMKAAFQVPWMGVVTMAFAHYRNFYDTLWDGLAPLCVSNEFVTACRDLRAVAETGVPDLAPLPIAGRLAAVGYAPREIDAIRGVIEAFSHGNFPYLLTATMARVLLEGHELSRERVVTPLAERDAPILSAPLVLMEAHHADAPTRAIYEDIKATIGLPFVNTDYRALARWPSYFATAWGDLRSRIATPPHEALAQSVHDRAVETARKLPNPGGLTSRALRVAAERDGALPEILETVRLFQWLLPGLATNVAFFRQQLRA